MTTRINFDNFIKPIAITGGYNVVFEDVYFFANTMIEAKKIVVDYFNDLIDHNGYKEV